MLASVTALLTKCNHQNFVCLFGIGGGDVGACLRIAAVEATFRDIAMGLVIVTCEKIICNASCKKLNNFSGNNVGRMPGRPTSIVDMAFTFSARGPLFETCII